MFRVFAVSSNTTLKALINSNNWAEQAIITIQNLIRSSVQNFTQRSEKIA